MTTARRGNLYNFLVVFTVALGSFTYGFNGTMIGSVLGLPSFWTYFNLSLSGSSAIVGATTGAFYGGGMIGSVISLFIANALGRKVALIITCIAGIVGGVLQAAAVNIAMFLVGRALTGICCGIFQAVVPVYQSEVSPPSQRGRMVGSHGFLTCVGGAVSVWIGLGCYFAENEQLKWRLLLAFTVLPPLLLLCATPFLPESPRWLIQRGKQEQAMAVLVKLHASPDDPDQLLPREEYVQICRQIELEKRDNKSVMESFRRPSTRKRLIIGLLVPFLINSTGSMVTANYQTILYGNLGIDGWLALFLLCVYLSWATLLNFLNSIVVDRLGRVKMLIIGLAGCSISLICYTAMVARFADNGNRVGCGFGIFFLYTFVTFFAGFLDVTGYVYWTEIFPTYARAAGVAVSTVSFFGTGLIYTQVAPTAFESIGWKFYFVFIIIPLCGIPIAYFYMPETKNLSLEEISALFGDEVALDISHLTAEEREALDKKITGDTGVAVTRKINDSGGFNSSDEKGTETRLERVSSN